MSVKYLILALVSLSATRTQAGGYSTFASTYNAHAINHAVAYPAGSKVAVPAPAFVSSPVPAAAPTTAVTLTPAADSKPAISAATPVPAGAGLAFAVSPFGLVVAPSKVGVAPIAFGTGAAYPNGPVFAGGPAYSPSYSAPPAYTSAYSGAPVFAATSPTFTTAPAGYPAIPAYAGVSPAYATLTGYAPRPASAASLASFSSTPIPAFW